jgi:hypothetical protein
MTDAVHAIKEPSDPFETFIALFNEGRYHACIAPLEDLWFAQRDDFHKALIRMCVGFNQIGLGLDSGPRFLLTTALELLAPYGTHHNGLDLTRIAAFLHTGLTLLDQPLPRVVPRFQIDHE